MLIAESYLVEIFLILILTGTLDRVSRNILNETRAILDYIKKVISRVLG